MSNDGTNNIPLSFLQYNIPTVASNELDFHLPSRTPLHGLTVAEWAGTKAKHNSKSYFFLNKIKLTKKNRCSNN
jgi:hypothetical protein